MSEKNKIDFAFIIKAETRYNVGKSASYNTRKSGYLPCVMYGANKEPKIFHIDLNDFKKEYSKGRIKAKIAKLVFSNDSTDKVENTEVLALIKDYQLHPVTDELLHVDFYQIQPGVEFQYTAYVDFTNKLQCIGIKKGGKLNIVSRIAKLKSAPENITANIECDISNLNLGMSIMPNDLQLPTGVTYVGNTKIPLLSITGKLESAEATTEATPAQKKK